MKMWFIALTLAILSGCVSQVPYKRPMQEKYQPALQDLQIYTYADKQGVGVRYFVQDSTAAGAQFGLLGMLVTSAIDGIANIGPRERSAKLANRLATGFDLLGIEMELQSALSRELAHVPGISMRPEIKHAQGEQKLEADMFAEPASLLVTVNYSMSPDLSHLIITSNARIFSQSMKYSPLYPKEDEELAAAEKKRQDAINQNTSKTNPRKKKPKEIPADQSGQLYRNTLTYISDALHVEGKSQSEIDAEVAAIRARYTDNNGKQTRNREQIVQMNREVKAASKPDNNNQLAERRAQKWLENDGALLKKVMAEGMGELSRLLAKDMQVTDIPQFNSKQSDLVQPIADGSRRIVIKTRGHAAGQYSSEPTAIPVQLWNQIAFGDVEALASSEQN